MQKYLELNKENVQKSDIQKNQQVTKKQENMAYMRRKLSQ